MKLVTREVRELTESEYNACYQLNLRGAGLMQARLVDCHRYGGTAIMLVKDDGNLLAWSLVFAWNLNEDLYGAYFYTRLSERRKGYGRRLAAEVEKHFPNIIVWPSDTRGKDFFSNHTFDQSLTYWSEYAGV